MIEYLHSLICGRVIIDRNTGLASYLDIIEGVNLKDPENFKIPTFSIVAKFWVKDGIGDDQILEIKISKKKSEKNKLEELQIIEIPLDKKGDNLLVDLKVENLDIKETGLWVFDIKWRLKDGGTWKKGSIIPFKVSIPESKKSGKEMGKKIAETKEIQSQ